MKSVWRQWTLWIRRFLYPGTCRIQKHGFDATSTDLDEMAEGMRPHLPVMDAVDPDEYISRSVRELLEGRATETKDIYEEKVVEATKCVLKVRIKERSFPVHHHRHWCRSPGV